MTSPAFTESSISFHALIAMSSLGDFFAEASKPSTIVPSNSIGVSPISSFSLKSSSRVCLLDSRGTSLSASGEMDRAAEVADRFGVCRSKAYGIIRELNEVMETRGCKVIAGRVSNEIFEEIYFNPKGGARHDC